MTVTAAARRQATRVIPGNQTRQEHGGLLLDWAVRRLIINADDLGLTAGVNRAILECWRNGIVTSATLMANGRAFAEAASAVREPAASRALGVGCHLGVVDGRPVLPPDQVSSLLADGTGEFRRSLVPLARAASLGQLRAVEVEAEMIAQIRALQSAGVRLSHVDAHKHAHMFPALLAPMLRAARACGVGAVRNPFEPPRPLPCRMLLARPSLWKRWAEVKALRALEKSFRRAVADSGLATADGTLGIMATGLLEPELFAALLAAMPDGTWELCCHPGYDDTELAGVRTRLRQSRERERQLLTSARAREVLARHDVELINYWSLQ